MKKTVLPVFMFLATGSLIVSLYALSGVSDSWVRSCLDECTRNNPSHKDCNQNSIAFIGDEYVRGRKGEPVWRSDAGNNFSYGFQAASHRMAELQAICPGAAAALKRGM